MSMLTSPSPNAILREIAERMTPHQIEIAARKIGMNVVQGSIYGTKEQWEQLRLSDLLFGS